MRPALMVVLLSLATSTVQARGVETWTCKDFSTLPEASRRGVSLGYAIGWMGAAEMTIELGASLEQDEVSRAGKAARVIAEGVGSDALYGDLAGRCESAPELALMTALRRSLIEVAKLRRSSQRRN